MRISGRVLGATIDPSVGVRSADRHRFEGSRDAQSRRGDRCGSEQFIEVRHGVLLDALIRW